MEMEMEFKSTEDANSEHERRTSCVVVVLMAVVMAVVLSSRLKKY